MVTDKPALSRTMSDAVNTVQTPNNLNRPKAGLNASNSNSNRNRNISLKPGVSSNEGSVNTTPNHGKSRKIVRRYVQLQPPARPNNWLVTIPIAILIPIFAMNMISLALPKQDCVYGSSTFDSCTLGNSQMNGYSFIGMIVVATVGLCLARGMDFDNVNATKGIAIGCCLLLFYAIYVHYNQVSSLTQALILGLAIVSIIYFPFDF